MSSRRIRNIKVKKDIPFQICPNVLTTLLSLTKNKSPSVFGGNGKKATLELFVDNDTYKIIVTQKDPMEIVFKGDSNTQIQNEIAYVKNKKKEVEQQLKEIRNNIVEVYLSTNDYLTMYKEGLPDDITQLMKGGIESSELLRLLSERGIPEDIVRRKNSYVFGVEHNETAKKAFDSLVGPYNTIKKEFSKWEKKLMFLKQIQFPLKLSMKQVEGSDFLRGWFKEDSQRLVFLDSLIQKCKNKMNTLVYKLRVKDFTIAEKEVVVDDIEIFEDDVVGGGDDAQPDSDAPTPESDAQLDINAPTPDSDAPTPDSDDDEDTVASELVVDDSGDLDLEQHKWTAYMFLKKLIFLKAFLKINKPGAEEDFKKGVLVRSKTDTTKIGVITNLVNKDSNVLWIGNYLNDSSLDEEDFSVSISVDDLDLIISLTEEKHKIEKERNVQLHTFPSLLYNFFSSLDETILVKPHIEVTVQQKNRDKVDLALLRLTDTDETYIRPLPDMDSDEDDDDVGSLDEVDSPVERRVTEENIGFLHQYIGSLLHRIHKGLLPEDMELLTMILK